VGAQLSDLPQGQGWWQASDGRWYPPQAWSVPPPSPSQAPSSESPTDRVEPFVAIIFAGVLGFVVVVVAIGIVVGHVTRSRVGLPTPPSITVPPGQPAGYSGPTYRGSGRLDHVADSSGRVDALGYAVTVTELGRVDAGNGRQVCGSATYTNTGTGQVPYDYFLDWKLLQPNGVEITPNPNGHISSGMLDAGGSTSGQVCFDDSGQRGQFVLIWLPISLGSFQRGIWLVQLP
jgi:hypothetical protein